MWKKTVAAILLVALLAVLGVYYAFTEGKSGASYPTDIMSNCSDSMQVCVRTLQGNLEGDRNLEAHEAVQVKTESTKPMEQRGWYTRAGNESYQQNLYGANITVNGVVVYEFDDNSERICNELPLGTIMVEMKKQGRVSIEKESVTTGWQGCLINCKGQECVVIDLRRGSTTTDEDPERTESFSSYKVLRNQVIVYSTSQSMQDYYVGVENVYTSTLALKLSFLEYVDHVVGRINNGVVARDSCISNWGAFDMTHYLNLDETYTRVRLTVGRTEANALLSFSWIQEGNAGSFGHVSPDTSVVECLTSSSSGTGICLEEGEIASVSSCFDGGVIESGTNMNGCHDQPSNALVELPGGIGTWNIELGKATRDASYGGTNLVENTLGEIFMTLKEQ